MEKDESEIDTAIREVFEEVGISVKIIDGFRTQDEYLIPRKDNVTKQIVYFLGYFTGQEIKYQKQELFNAELMDYEKAINSLQFESSKRILKLVNDFLKNYDI